MFVRMSCVQLQRELNTRQAEGAEAKEGGQRGVFSPQDNPPRSPRSLRSPGTSAPVRSHSDSEAMLEEQGAATRLKGPTENLFLDALTLDPLTGLEVPPPSRLESEKKFPCMKEVTPLTVAVIRPGQKSRKAHNNTNGVMEFEPELK